MKKLPQVKQNMYLLKNELKKIKTFGSCSFIDQSYFNYDGAQLYQMFQPIYKTITTFSDIPNIISEWKSKGSPNQKFRPSCTTN